MTVTLLDFSTGDVSLENEDGSPSPLDTGDVTDADVPAILRFSLPSTATVIQRRAYAGGERRLTVAALLAEYDSGLGVWGWTPGE